MSKEIGKLKQVLELENRIYSVFEFKRFDNINGIWVKDFSFYMFNFSESNVDLSNDWRFKEVKNKRSKGVFIGMYNGTFPVIMPLENNINFIPQTTTRVVRHQTLTT